MLGSRKSHIWCLCASLTFVSIPATARTVPTLPSTTFPDCEHFQMPPVVLQQAWDFFYIYFPPLRIKAFNGSIGNKHHWSDFDNKTICLIENNIGS